MVIALVAVSHAWRPGMVVGDGVDLYGTFWFFWWVGDCLHHLRDPSFTDLMFHPLGKDIFAHTGDNFVDALLSTPFQAVFGYPDFEPWFVAFVMVGNALSFRWLARDLFRSRAAVIASTVLWQLCPFLLFELMCGRITQAFVWFLPLAVRAFLHIGGVGEGARLPGARPHGWRWRDPLLAGLWTGLQAWTYWFMGYFMVLLFAWLGGVELVRRPERGRRVLGWLLAAATAAAVVAPGVFAMAHRAAAGQVPGVAAATGGVLGEPARLANNVAQHLHGYWLMETQGQPVFRYWVWGLGLLLAIAVARERLRWVGALLLALLFALGPAIPWRGGSLPIPPYLLAYHLLPFFDRLWFPMRLVVIAMLAAAILLGQLVDRAEELRQARWPRLPPWLLPAALILLNMGEQHRVLAFPLLARDLTTPQIYRAIGALGGGLIELPIGMARPSIAWQPIHRQFTFGGMAENAPIFYPPGFRRRLANSFIVYLRMLTREPDQVRDYTERSRQELVDEGFRWVVLDRQLVDADIYNWGFARHNPPQAIERAPFMVEQSISAHLGPPVMAEERLLVWDLVGGAEVPPALVPTPADLGERTWPREEMPEYERWLRESGRFGGPPAGPRPQGEQPAGAAGGQRRGP